MANTVYAEYTTYAAMTTVIPNDNTIPQNTEGTEILTAAITPVSASNKIRVRFMGWGSANTALTPLAAALFKDSDANALQATRATSPSTGNAVQLAFEYEESAGSTNARTYKVRVGPTVADTIHMNGSPFNRIFGGICRSTLVVEEIPV